MTTFPSSPIPNQEHTEDSITYIFTGSKWDKITRSNSFKGTIITESSNTAAIDLSQGNFFELAYDSNTLVSFTNPPASGSTQSFKILVNSPASEGFSLANASYDNLSASVGSTGPYGLFFKPDGREVYFVDNPNDRILQYSLSTPWRIDTMSTSTSILFSVATQENSPLSFCFDPTGTIMIVAGNTNKTVYRYVLTTPWLITTAAYSSQFLLVSAQEGTPFGLTFKSDGTKLYVSGNSTNTIYQYNLPTPWSLTSATYDNKFLALGAQDTTSTCHRFNTDGTKLLVSGGTNNKVYQYNLSTPWDVSTGTYSGISTSVAVGPYGMHFKPEGDKMYILGFTGKRVYQYSTVATTATVTWPASVLWQEGQAPVLTPGKRHMIEFYTSDGGTSYYASTVERDIS